MNYRKYSDEDILETYNSMLEYSGRADKDLIAEIYFLNHPKPW
jgi:hypothetical protein